MFETMGYCPQHDALWDNITVAEHIAGYAEIRGIRRDQIHLYVFIHKLLKLLSVARISSIFYFSVLSDYLYGIHRGWSIGILNVFLIKP